MKSLPYSYCSWRALPQIGGSQIGAFLIGAFLIGGCGGSQESPSQVETTTAPQESAPSEAPMADLEPAADNTPPEMLEPQGEPEGDPGDELPSPTELGSYAPEFGLPGLAEIRAYHINLDGPSRGTGILVDGALNRDRQPQDGIALSREQALLVHQAMTGEHDSYARARCYNPHHAFLFLSESGEKLGDIGICFECSTYSTEMGGGMQRPRAPIDFSALRTLFRGIGLSQHTRS